MDIKKIWQTNKVPVIIVLSLVGLTVLLVILTIVLQPGNNRPLTKDERHLQSIIQKEMDNSNIRLNDVLISDGEWQLVNVNTTDDKTNTTMIIAKQNEPVMGPASNFDLSAMINVGVPDKIIDHFYPSKPQYVNFGDNFNSYFPYSQGQVKFVINAFATSNNINVNRVTLLDGKINQTVQNARDTNRTEITTFKFTLNSDKITYTFSSTYTAINNQITYAVSNSDGTVLYTQQTSI